MTTYTVRAKRWRHGWELHIDGVGVTQSRTLAKADQMVRDYIETLTGVDVTDAIVLIEPELGGIEKRLVRLREQMTAVEESQRAFRENYHAVAADLRKLGLSAADTAAILGKSRGRISQISKASSKVSAK